MTKILYTVVAIISLQLASGQDSFVQVDMIPLNWNIPNDAKFEKFDGRETLILKSGRAAVQNLTFTDGIIEVDVYATSKRSFAGINFRVNQNDMEEVYLRMHKSNQVDAIQYTPIFNDESNWQLYREHQAKVAFKETGWNTLRIDVRNSSAKISINGQEVLSVNQLKTDGLKGGIGLWALFGSRFSNFRVLQKDISENSDLSKASDLNPNLITNWDITQAFPFEEDSFDVESFSKAKYTKVFTEESGLLPISKYVKKSSAGSFEQNGEDYIVATQTIHSDKKRTQAFSFDYSDKIMLYLNGTLVFKGNNAFRAKGVQHTGHIGLDANRLYLQLEKGTNQIHCVVIDKANGWGLIAKWE